jgi:hypothetical protein
MLKEFIKWMKDNNSRLLEEGVWGTWDYKVPQDKKQQMYDFYMIESLLPPGIHMWLRPLDFGVDDPDLAKAAEDKDRAAQGLPLDPRVAGDEAKTIEDKFYHALYEAANKLIPTLKKELLQVVNFSIAAELRHLFDHADSKHDIKGLVDKIRKEFGPKEAEMLKKYAVHFMGQQSSSGLKSLLDIDRHKIHPNLVSHNKNYKASYRAMKESGGSDEDWAKLAAWLFRNIKWDSSFGGEPWAQIADGWLRLHNAKHAGEIIVAIDHVYDLQHNTDTVFNKIDSYAKGGSYDWVMKALDHKRYLVSPHEMIEHVSKPMQELALIGIKLQTGKSWGDFEKNWSETLKKKTEIYNDTKKSMYQDNKNAYKKKYGYSPPTESTPEQFAQIAFDPSDSEWSLHKVHQFSKIAPDTAGATEDPTFDQVKIGGQVALEWPPKRWHTILAKNPGGQPTDFPYKGATTNDGVTLTDWGTTPFNMVHGYRPKGSGIVAPPTPAVSAPQAHKDATGKEINIGDTVKKLYTVSGKQGKVIKLHPGNTVEVKWDMGTFKTYPAKDLVIQQKASATPPATPAVMTVPQFTSPHATPATPHATPTPATPTPATGYKVPDAYGHILKVGDTVKKVGGNNAGVGVIISLVSSNSVVVKWEGDTEGNYYYGTSLLYLSSPATPPATSAKPEPSLPMHPLPTSTPDPFAGTGKSEPETPKSPVPPPKFPPPAAKPSWNPPSAEEEKASNKAKANMILDGLPKVSKPIKYARVIRGMNGFAWKSHAKMIEELESALDIKLTPEEKLNVVKAYKDDTEYENYFRNRGHIPFPKHLTSEQAWTALQQKFHEHPYVKMDAETNTWINDLLIQHNHVGAVQVARKATQYDSGALTGYIVLKKLELYLDNKIAN